MASLTSSLSIVLIGLMTGVIVARVLGPEGRGLLASVVTWTTLLVALFQIPISETLVLRNGQGLRQGDYGAALGLLLSVAAMAVVPLIWILESQLKHFEKLNMAIVISFSLIFLLSQNLWQLYRGFFQVKKRFSQIQFYAIMQPALYLIFLLPLLVISNKPTVNHAVIALTLGIGSTELIRIFVSGFPFLEQTSISRIRSLLSASIPLYFSRMIQMLGTQGDRLLVVYLISAAEVGIFFVALTFSSVLPGLFNTAIKLLALPALTGIELNHRSHSAIRLISLSWVSGVLGFVATALLGPYLIPFLFGSEFKSAVILSVFIAGTLAFSNVRTSLLEALKSYDASASVIYAPILYSVFLLLMSYLLFPQIGVLGIVAARGLAEIITIMMLSAQVRRYAPEISIQAWIVPSLSDIFLILQALETKIKKKQGNG